MKIGIVGSGNIGGNAARLFVRAGHEVALSNSRGGEGLDELVKELGDKAHATTIENAAKFGDVVLVAIPFGNFSDLPAGAFKGKVVIDSGNYYPERDGKFPQLDRDETTSSELMSAHLKGGATRQRVQHDLFQTFGQSGRHEFAAGGSSSDLHRR